MFHALSAKSVKVNLKYDFLIAQRTQCPIVIEIRIDKIDKELCHDMKTKGMLLSESSRCLNDFTLTLCAIDASLNYNLDLRSSFL